MSSSREHRTIGWTSRGAFVIHRLNHEGDDVTTCGATVPDGAKPMYSRTGYPSGTHPLRCHRCYDIDDAKSDRQWRARTFNRWGRGSGLNWPR